MDVTLGLIEKDVDNFNGINDNIIKIENGGDMSESEKKKMNRYGKKINRFSISECNAELVRLENAGEHQSRYYKDIEERIQAINRKAMGMVA